MSTVTEACEALEPVLAGSIAKPLSLEQALEVVEWLETWCEATREALNDDIRRRDEGF